MNGKLLAGMAGLVLLTAACGNRPGAGKYPFLSAERRAELRGGHGSSEDHATGEHGGGEKHGASHDSAEHASSGHDSGESHGSGAAAPGSAEGHASKETSKPHAPAEPAAEPSAETPPSEPEPAVTPEAHAAALGEAVAAAEGAAAETGAEAEPAAEAVSAAAESATEAVAETAEAVDEAAVDTAAAAMDTAEAAQAVTDAAEAVAPPGESEAEAVVATAAAVEAPAAVPAVSKSKLKKGKKVFTANCVACHQLTGKGLAGAFPPLVGSDWVLGDPARPVAIVLNGLMGEIEVNGKKYNNVMAGLGAILKDKDVANVVTYVRNAWGNSASEVDEAFVKKIRAKLDGKGMWTNPADVTAFAEGL